MRNLTIAGAFAAAALTSIAAQAADLPVRGPAMAPEPIFVQTYSWSGFYVGLNAGAAWKGNRCNPFSVTGNQIPGVLNSTCAGNTGDDNVGFTGGAQLGYNWQFGGLVAGVEADINALSSRNGSSAQAVFPFNGGNHPFDGTYLGSGNKSGNYFGTARVRLGYAMDRALLYVTGGLAWDGGGNQNSQISFFHNQVPPVVGAPNAVITSLGNNSRVGWALGAGVEYALSNNWSARIEYLHANFGGNNRNGGFACASPGNFCAQFAASNARFNFGNRRNDVDLVRVGVNYKFGGSSAGPVLARY
jgi:outer membrane immunogenic protein